MPRGCTQSPGHTVAWICLLLFSGVCTPGLARLPPPASLPFMEVVPPQKGTELSPREQDTPQRKGLQETPHSCNLVPSEIYAGPVLSCYAVGR